MSRPPKARRARGPNSRADALHRTSRTHGQPCDERLRLDGDGGLPGSVRTGVLGRLRPRLCSRIPRLLLATDGTRAEARRAVWATAFHLALHQLQGVGEPGAVE